MAEEMANALKDAVPSELAIFIISLLPILELRGGLIAASILGVPWIVAFPICVIGNVLPIPFILMFLKRVFLLLKRNKTFAKIVDKMEQKASKGSKKLEKYKLWGLFCFVAVPLPGTGAWTGALVADFVEIPIRHSLPVIVAGVVAAAGIMSAVSYLIPGLFF